MAPRILLTVDSELNELTQTLQATVESSRGETSGLMHENKHRSKLYLLEDTSTLVRHTNESTLLADACSILPLAVCSLPSFYTHFP